MQVSRRDFPDAADLTELQDAIGRSDLKIQVSDTLGAGDCRLQLRLGTMELDLPRQWEALSEALLDIARNDVGS